MILPTIDPKQPLQTQYQPAVNDLVNFLRSGIGKNLHSIYLYGSVARKTATPGRSNLDIIVVTERDFFDSRTTVFNTVRWRFQKAYPFIKDISFKTALVNQVASLDSIFSWGFQLRHCSLCVYGEDLSECFGDYEPSWEIAKHWNMDLADWLAVYRKRIAQAKDDSEQVNAQVQVAKKLLRASYGAVIPRDRNWFDDPVECGKHFLRYHPDKRVEVERLVILLSGRLIAKRSVIGIIDAYGHWLTKLYNKTEFRIG